MDEEDFKRKIGLKVLELKGIPLTNQHVRANKVINFQLSPTSSNKFIQFQNKKMTAFCR